MSPRAEQKVRWSCDHRTLVFSLGPFGSLWCPSLDSDFLELGDDHGCQAVALQVGLDEGVLLAGEPRRDPSGVIYDHLLGLVVEGDALTHVLNGTGLFEELVDLQVGVASVVHATLGVEEDVQEVLRVGIVGGPAESGVGLELLSIQIFEIGRPLNLLDLDFHAKLLASTSR